MSQGSRSYDIDLDVLRGWREVAEPGLDSPHALPALAELVCESREGVVRSVFPIHGPETYIGRFHPQHGPVDVVLHDFLDHEIYKFSAPHVRLTLESGRWQVRPVSPAAVTDLNGTPLHDTRQQYPIEDGDVLTLGCTDFVFRTKEATYDGWQEGRKALLTEVEKPALFLVRFGGVCGPFRVVRKQGTTIGRSFPKPREMGNRAWSIEEQPDWNLAGLREYERKFIGFRHVGIRCEGKDDWILEPLTLRQRTFVNRVEVTTPTPLMPGDEIGLGSVLFHFHHPRNLRASTESRTAELPAVVDWNEDVSDSRLDPLNPESEVGIVAPSEAEDTAESAAYLEEETAAATPSAKDLKGLAKSPTKPSDDEEGS